MNDYGNHFLATVAAGPTGPELHWSVRPFWHDLRVQVHRDGISVLAPDDLAAATTAIPAQRRSHTPRREPVPAQAAAPASVPATTGVTV